MKLNKKEKSFLKKAIPVTAFIAGLCCFTPVVFVLFGLSSVAFAASLADNLYGNYKWVFRGISLGLLLAALGWYFYSKEGICSLDAAKRKKKKIINLTLITLSIAILSYIIWLYIIVEIIGIWLGIWG